MGVKHWGAGLVAAALISGITASSAPAVQASPAPSNVLPVILSVPAAQKSWEPTADLPATLADKYVAETPRVAAPDKLAAQWACNLPMHIYYAAAPGVDDRVIVKQLEYPVEYLRALGYTVQVVREVSYLAGYRTPTTPGDVLLVVALSGADAKFLRGQNWIAMTERTFVGRSIPSAKTTVDGRSGLASDVLLHEFGHILGMEHKEGSVMGVTDTASLPFDAAETAAVDCR